MKNLLLMVSLMGMMLMAGNTFATPEIYANTINAEIDYQKCLKVQAASKVFSGGPPAPNCYAPTEYTGCNSSFSGGDCEPIKVRALDNVCNVYFSETGELFMSQTVIIDADMKVTPVPFAKMTFDYIDSFYLDWYTQ